MLCVHAFCACLWSLSIISLMFSLLKNFKDFFQCHHNTFFYSNIIGNFDIKKWAINSEFFHISNTQTLSMDFYYFFVTDNWIELVIELVFDLIIDINMILLYEKGIRGGVTILIIYINV